MPDLLKDRVVAAVGDVYDVEAEIGRGGSAVVYRAIDVRLRRKVALKVLPPELAYREDVRSRFLREAQTSAQLSHPHIVPIYAVDERDGLVFFVMCLVEGESVAARLRREPRPPLDFVRRVLRETADALAYAHSRGVVHRDIKPDNIMLDRDSGRVMVTDFGIARALEGADARLTVTGIAVGTPAYMSPEQALGERDVDARSDIYSLGVVGYLMLAGELPFKATNTPAMLMKHISEPPPPLGASRPDAPAPLREAIERALRKKPEERWASAAEMRDALAGDGRWSAPIGPPPRPSAAAAAPAAAHPDPHAAPHLLPHALPHSAPHDGAADRRGDAFPPMPAFPKPGGSSNSREVWRQQQRLWREQVRAQRQAREAAAAPMPPVPAPVLVSVPRPASPAGMPYPLPHEHAAALLGGDELERRFHSFRRKLKGVVVTIGFLAFINLITFPFPWVVFPAMGMLGKLRPRWQELQDAGVSRRDVWRGRLPAHLGGRDPKVVRLEARQRAAMAKMEAAAQAKRGRVLVQWRDPEALKKRVRRFRRAVRTTLAAAVVALVTLIVGGGASIDWLIPVFVLGLMVTGGAGLVSVIDGRRIKRAGLRRRDMLRDGWLAALEAADPRPRAAIVDEEVARLVPADVAAGPHGDTVRRAVADRAEVRDAFAKMSPTDRALLPDVTATVDALVGRVAMLAQALHRLDEDHPAAMLRTLEERLAQAERGPTDSPDRERRLGLLQRQQATLQDLVRRRETLAGQLESAALVLQSVRLDLLKLRSAGIQSALEDVTSATQQARALSREIGHVLDAVDEVRAL